MQRRVGIIMTITGIILLLKPNFDIDQLMLSFNFLASKYWPIALVALGILLQTDSKPKRTRNR